MAKEDVNLKRKVTLRTKTQGEPDVTTTQPQAPNPIPEPEPAKSKSWIWWILGLVVVAVIAFFCLKSCGNESDVKEGETTEETSAVAQPTDEQDNGELVAPNDEASVTEASDASEPETANESADDASQSQEPQKPSESATTNPAQPTQSNTPVALVPTAGDVETEALNVIRGDYGNAPVRYDLLRQKGLDAQAIQRRVNELKREGVF